MKNRSAFRKLERITHRIFVVRDQRVILDSDLAGIYGVKTKSLNLAVKRNISKFPSDFMFRLTQAEHEHLRFQIETSKKERGGRRYLPCVFTEHGAIMAATILHSERAVRMSLFVVRAFVRMRALLSDNRKLADELKEIERKMTQRLDVHELAIVDVLRRVMRLLEPPPETLAPEKPPIGFRP